MTSTSRSSGSRSTPSSRPARRSSAAAAPRSALPPNSQVCPVCLGLPGALPVLNRRPSTTRSRPRWRSAARCSRESIFARKNYFYPDLPKGYQISQYERPLALGGGLDITVDGATQRVGLTRIHMEEDAGKSLHEGFPDSDRRTYVDYNRSGVPLIEIVSRARHALRRGGGGVLSRLRDILVWLGVNDGNMEEGSLRCDANVSVRPRGADEVRHQGRGQERQLLPLSRRRRSTTKSSGRSTSSRAAAASSRRRGCGTRRPAARTRCAARKRRTTTATFPNPICRRSSSTRRASRACARRCPSCPRRAGSGSSRSTRFPEYDAGVLTQSAALADYFEAVAAAVGQSEGGQQLGHGRAAADAEGARPRRSSRCRLRPSALAGLIALIDKGTDQQLDRQGRLREDVRLGPLGRRDRRGRRARADRRRRRRCSRSSATSSPPTPTPWRSTAPGKMQTFGFLVGQVMKGSGGKANPKLANESAEERASSNCKLYLNRATNPILQSSE